MNASVDAQALVNEWLAALGRATGLRLRLDEEGVCGIGHASGVDCAIEVPEGGDSLYLRAPLMPWPGRHPLRMAERCLEAQFLGLATQGASFAIDPRDSELVLWQCVPLAVLDGDALARRVTGFLELAARWREDLLAADGPSRAGRQLMPWIAGA